MQYGGGKERVLYLGVLELLFNEQRCHCENCIVYKFFMLKYLYGICICRKVYFGYTLLYVMGLLFREFETIIWPIVGVMFFVYFDSIVYYSKYRSRYAEIIVYAILVN